MPPARPSLHALFRTLLTLAALGLAAAAVHAQDVELYEQTNFGGRRVTVGNATPDLRLLGFNDRTNSVIVHRGQWEFCTDALFRGTCVSTGPGRFAQLPEAFPSRLTSLRPVAAPPSASSSATSSAITVYEMPNQQGRSLAIAGTTPNLRAMGFNDRASSVLVARGRWQLCEHADFTGRCIVLGPGRHELEGAANKLLTSLRPVFGRDDTPLGAAGGLTLYEHIDFRGKEIFRAQDTPNLGALGFNDRTSSIEVHAGSWELCSDADHQGRCLVFGPGRHAMPPELHDRLSSLRPAQR